MLLLSQKLFRFLLFLWRTERVCLTLLNFLQSSSIILELGRATTNIIRVITNAPILLLYLSTQYHFLRGVILPFMILELTLIDSLQKSTSISILFSIMVEADLIVLGSQDGVV